MVQASDGSAKIGRAFNLGQPFKAKLARQDSDLQARVRVEVHCHVSAPASCCPNWLRTNASCLQHWSRPD